eukprot:scaffold50515_cov56-Phaeocystis_antarctica.AAC.4
MLLHLLQQLRLELGRQPLARATPAAAPGHHRDGQVGRAAHARRVCSRPGELARRARIGRGELVGIPLELKGDHRLPLSLDPPGEGAARVRRGCDEGAARARRGRCVCACGLSPALVCGVCAGAAPGPLLAERSQRPQP